MNLKQLEEEAAKMQVGDRKTFELDEIPPRRSLSLVVARLSIRTGRGFSSNRSEKTVTVHCYEPPKPKSAFL